LPAQRFFLTLALFRDAKFHPASVRRGRRRPHLPASFPSVLGGLRPPGLFLEERYRSSFGFPYSCLGSLTSPSLIRTSNCRVGNTTFFNPIPKPFFWGDAQFLPSFRPPSFRTRIRLGERGSPAVSLLVVPRPPDTVFWPAGKRYTCLCDWSIIPSSEPPLRAGGISETTAPPIPLFGWRELLHPLIGVCPRRSQKRCQLDSATSAQFKDNLVDPPNSAPRGLPILVCDLLISRSDLRTRCSPDSPFFERCPPLSISSLLTAASPEAFLPGFRRALSSPRAPV